jgi:hypothetical protein
MLNGFLLLYRYQITLLTLKLTRSFICQFLRNGSHEVSSRAVKVNKIFLGGLIEKTNKISEGSWNKTRKKYDATEGQLFENYAI